MVKDTVLNKAMNPKESKMGREIVSIKQQRTTEQVKSRDISEYASLASHNSLPPRLAHLFPSLSLSTPVTKLSQCASSSDDKSGLR